MSKKLKSLVIALSIILTLSLASMSLALDYTRAQSLKSECWNTDYIDYGIAYLAKADQIDRKYLTLKFDLPGVPPQVTVIHEVWLETESGYEITQTMWTDLNSDGVIDQSLRRLIKETKDRKVLSVEPLEMSDEDPQDVLDEIVEYFEKERKLI